MAVFHVFSRARVDMRGFHSGWTAAQQQQASRVQSGHSSGDLLTLQSAGSQLQSAHLIIAGIILFQHNKLEEAWDVPIPYASALHRVRLLAVLHQLLPSGESPPACRALEFLYRRA